MNGIGKRIRALRLATPTRSAQAVEPHMSQRELSELAGPRCSHAHISRIESGSREASMHVLRRIGAVLGVSAHFLETGRQEAVLVLPLQAAQILAGMLATPQVQQAAVDAGLPLDDVRGELARAIREVPS